MTTATVPQTTSVPTRSSAGRAILAAGLACGILDITAACVSGTVRGGTPMRVLHSVASALLGGSAFQGGVPTAALGLLMHFAVAFTWATLFYVLSRKFPVLVQHAIPAGLAYGALVYGIMYWGVIPGSALVRRLYLPNVTVPVMSFAVQAFVIHLLCVGLPIALAVRRFSPRTIV